MASLASDGLEQAFVRFNQTVELHRLEPLSAGLEEAYGRTGNWSFLTAFDFAGAMRPLPAPGAPGLDFRLPPPHIMELARRIVIYDQDGKLVWGHAYNKNKVGLELLSGGRTIGSLQLSGSSPDIEAETEFKESQKKAIIGLWTGAFIALVIVGQLIIGMLGGDRKRLADALLKLKQGERQVTIDDPELKPAFDALAKSLTDLDSGHRQWVADTSHELRTPIAVLRAQVEAFQDGVQEITPRNLAVLHGEIMSLSKLVDDLHWLAKYDVGQIRVEAVPIDLNQVLQETLDSFEERREAKAIKLDNQVPADEKLIITGDSTRLRQVLTNLIENSLRYTAEGGTLQISHSIFENQLKLRFDDTEPGVPEELLPRLFDRFFRVESSRARTMGGSGLGLAICLSNMQVLGGSITASHSPMGGLRIELTFPAHSK